MSYSSKSRQIRFILNYKGFPLSFYIVFKSSSLTWTYRLHVDYQDKASDLQPTGFDFRDVTLRLILSFETINGFNLCQIYLCQLETSELDKLSYITAWNNHRYLPNLKIYKIFLDLIMRSFVVTSHSQVRVQILFSFVANIFEIFSLRNIEILLYQAPLPWWQKTKNNIIQI